MYIEVIKWNWQPQYEVDISTLPSESVYYYDDYDEAIKEYKKDVEHLLQTDATVYLTSVIKMKAR